MKRQIAGERLALGIGLGTMIGVLTGNVGLWLAVGVALGIVMSKYTRSGSMREME
jgi:hypothetical protein